VESGGVAGVVAGVIAGVVASAALLLCAGPASRTLLAPLPPTNIRAPPTNQYLRPSRRPIFAPLPPTNIRAPPADHRRASRRVHRRSPTPISKSGRPPRASPTPKPRPRPRSSGSGSPPSLPPSARRWHLARIRPSRSPGTGSVICPLRDRYVIVTGPPVRDGLGAATCRRDDRVELLARSTRRAHHHRPDRAERPQRACDVRAIVDLREDDLSARL